MITHGQLDSVEFAENPEPRCPCVLLLDVSGSMQGAAIAALNEGLVAYKAHLSGDALASRRVETALVTFNDAVRVEEDFVTVDAFDPPQLAASGLTHMGAAIEKSLDLIEARKEEYKANGIAYYRPWVFMITDGEPQGESDADVSAAERRLHDAVGNKRIAFFAVGVEGANMVRLAAISPRPPVKLSGLNFVEMFQWLSASMKRVSQSQTSDDQIALPPPGWAAV
ncbi:MAG: VWA domain-containing protein [Armatimonadetes bacterium]|nr:VWA domain-containing protein [Armatimonadota bacterium]MDE2205960.1 VWA domain-containing protein [Armatimonadota bacterium]